MCCKRIISVHINRCRFFILLLIIYSGFHTEPWAVIFSDNAWQRQQNILKKLTKQPACATTSFNSNCNSKIRLIVFLKSCIFSIPEYHPFFYCVVLLRCLGKILSQFKFCVVGHVNIFISFILMLSQFQAYPFSLGIFLAFCSYSGHFSLTKASFG